MILRLWPERAGASNDILGVEWTAGCPIPVCGVPNSVPMERVLAVRKRRLWPLIDPRLVLTAPKDGVIGLPDRLTKVNTTSRKPIPYGRPNVSPRVI
jgi:hypothetical protein